MRTSTYRAGDTLRVLIGTQAGASAPAERAFFFDQTIYLGTDARAPSAQISLLSHSDTEVTLGYAIYRAGHRRRARSGACASRSTWVSSAPLDPLPERRGATLRPGSATDRSPRPSPSSRWRRSCPWRRWRRGRTRRAGASPVAPVAPVGPVGPVLPVRPRGGPDELHCTGIGVSASSAGHVAASATPVGGSPREVWNASSALTVAASKMPLMGVCGSAAARYSCIHTT